MELTNFKIKNLFEKQDYDLKFSDNRLILVGENGAGKTTVLRMLFLFLSGRWEELQKYTFDSVSVSFSETEFTIEKDVLLSTVKKIRSRMQHTHRLAHRGRQGLLIEDIDDTIDGNSMKELYLQSVLSKSDQIGSKPKKLQSYTTDAHILYLPTYRRIEQNLGDIFNNLDVDEFELWRRRRMRSDSFHYGERSKLYTELVEFGMGDVKKAIENKLEQLKEFTSTQLNSLTLAYLGDVVDRKYQQVNVDEIKNVEDDTVKNILGRIDSTIISMHAKTRLLEIIQDTKNKTTIDEHEQVICHYFSKLLNFHEDLEKEEQGIRKFCEVCNTYMKGKSFEYTSSSFEFKIVDKKHFNSIDLSMLSSGEKQVVSLFSSLYLSTQGKFFLMIDEPELSLSVPWQRKFLQDISDSTFCSGFLAVTHSPFIYDNELEKYTHALGEFIKEI